MEGASSSFNFNFAERDVQLLNESKFHDSEKNEDFSNNDSDNDSNAKTIFKFVLKNKIKK